MSTKLKCSVLKIYSWPVGRKDGDGKGGCQVGQKKEEIAEMLVVLSMMEAENVQ